MTKAYWIVLPAGLYRVFWRADMGGGQSLAAVGVTYNGMRWLAPTNWITVPMDRDRVKDSWNLVERVELIEAAK